jgi:hypothetical protein
MRWPIRRAGAPSTSGHRGRHALERRRQRARALVDVRISRADDAARVEQAIGDCGPPMRA